ncbi:unnamed protein product, partial [Effrenium voratum]
VHLEMFPQVADRLRQSTGKQATAVVLPTLVRTPQDVKELKATLSALASQTQPPDAVILVDDFSPQNLQEKELWQGPGLALVRLHQNVGPAGARTVGLRLLRQWARGRDVVVCLTDSDAAPDKNWIEQMQLAQQRRPGIVCGPTLSVDKSHTGRFHDHFGNLNGRWSERFCTCNFSVDLNSIGDDTWQDVGDRRINGFLGKTRAEFDPIFSRDVAKEWEASPGLTTPRCGNVMEELEELRDALLDRFEEVGDRLSLVAFQDEVRSMQKRSSTPAFWAEVLEAHSEGGPGSLSISEVTVLLLALLRDAAAWQLTLSPSHLHTGFATLPQNGEGGQAEDLSILAKHLRQALDTDTSPQDLSRPLWTSSVTGCETCTGGYVAAGRLRPLLVRESPSAPRRHLRSAMLSLQDEADDSPGGWMRTAMLPLRGPCADEAAELRDTPREAADGTLDSNATIPMPLLSDPGLRRTAAAAVLNEDASQAEHNTGDWLEGWKGQRIWARSAMLPVSTLPSLEPVDASAKLGMPVLLHIYDVTQERGIRRLNKVLANKRLPIKFGGVFHAGVEVDGREWSYGCTESEDDPGVLANKPKMHPDHHYRQTVNMSQTPLSAGEICKLLQELTTEYPGPEYDLLRRNCCHFADDFCRRLGVGRIPSWVHRLARIAARIETILQAAQRIRN